jgi:DeoR family transcriptional regulator of aga operon
MLRSQRQAHIIAQLQAHGFVEIAQLCKELGTDRSTARRDLLDLARRGFVQRTRGGALAGAAIGNLDIPYAVKRSEHLHEKQAIGRAAAKLVGPSETVILDSGSTTYQVAVALRGRRDISVITNDLRIATTLAESPRAQLFVTGGILLESVYTLVGPQTVEQLRSLRVDRTFLGADAIHHSEGVTNITMVEVEVKRAMIAAARRVTVVADSSKFERRSVVPVCALGEVDEIVTDGNLPTEVRHLYGDVLRTVPVADEEGGPQGAHEHPRGETTAQGRTLLAAEGLKEAPAYR